MENMEEIKGFIMGSIDQYLCEENKAATMVWIDREGIPLLTEIVKVVKEKLKEQGSKEGGWNKFRDKYFYPVLLDIIFFVVKELVKNMVGVKKPE